MVLQASDVAVLLPKIAGLAAAELATPHPLLDPAMLVAILLHRLGGRADAATQRSQGGGSHYESPFHFLLLWHP
jgi:hypothetical protein